MSNEGCSAETFLKGGMSMSMYISCELERQMVNAAKDLAERAIMACGEKYNFDGSEAVRLLGLSNVKVERQKPVTVKKAKEVVAKAAFPLPYNGEFNETCCFALRQNNGLYTQCQTARKGENSFCKGCQVLADKNEGVPEYGTIQQRQAVGVFEYTDPKGRKPVSYMKVMKKYKVSEEQVLAEAGKFGMEINAAHFVVAEATETKRGRPKVATEKVSEPKGPKGRPKKSKKVLEIAGEEHEDLFAAMVANAQEGSDSEDEDEMPAKEDEKAELAKQKAAKLAAEKAEKAAELAKQKEALAMQKAAEKEALAKQKAAEKAELAKQREALAKEKAAAEKAEKEALLQQKKAAFEEAKAAKKAALEAKKVKKEEPKEAKQKKATKQEQAASKEEPAKQEQAASKEEASKEEASEEEAESISVKEKTVNGKLYLISKANLVYDHHEWTANGEQVVIGKWNKAEKKIEFTADSESEESEEEYEEEE